MSEYSRPDVDPWELLQLAHEKIDKLDKINSIITEAHNALSNVVTNTVNNLNNDLPQLQRSQNALISDYTKLIKKNQQLEMDLSIALDAIQSLQQTQLVILDKLK